MNQACSGNTASLFRLTPRFIANALGLSAPPNADAEFAGWSTDSRKIQPGALFIALKGDTHDGHDHIVAAIEKGARGVLCTKGRTPGVDLAKVQLFEASDSLAGFRALAGSWRRQFQGPLAVIAGSNGKTTTKELLSALLRGKYPQTLKTAGSQNGFVGVPMTLLELGAAHGAAVIEVGIDEPGAMEQHLALVEPGFAVLTSIGPEHLETLKDIDTVAREEGIALTRTLDRGGRIAVHLGDPLIRPHWKPLHRKAPERVIGFWLEGSEAPPEASGSNVIRGRWVSDGREVEIEGRGLLPTRYPLPLPGRHNASNFLAAFALAVSMGLNEAEIRAGLRTFEGAQGRSEVRRLFGDTPVLCDYYNASPASMTAALELLNQIGHVIDDHYRRRWACLGDMLELGASEEAFHRELAPRIFRARIENVLLYGTRMKWLQDELVKLGFSGRVEHFATHAELARALTEGAKPGDAILIKGSRSMKMEEIWKALEPHAQKTWPTIAP